MIGRSPRCLLLATVALLAVPAAGMASPVDIPDAVPPQFRAAVRARLHSPPVKSASVSSFDLKSAQGYSVSVVALGSVVALEVTHGKNAPPSHGGLFKHGQSVAAYVARGSVTPNRIEASFGHFGRIEVQFHPSGQIATSKPRRHCKGPDRFTSRLGVFVGSIRFTGENHYVSVRAHRAKGRVRGPLQLHCASRHFHVPVTPDSRPVRGFSGPTPMTLSADWRKAIDSTDFLTFQIGKEALFLAVTEQSKGSMAEVRYAVAVAPAEDFVSDDTLTSAAVKPPPPFKGTGSYSAAPDGTKSWTGPLSASFPGAPRFPLTGPQFEVTLASGF